MGIGWRRGGLRAKFRRRNVAVTAIAAAGTASEVGCRLRFAIVLL